MSQLKPSLIIIKMVHLLPHELSVDVYGITSLKLKKVRSATFSRVRMEKVTAKLNMDIESEEYPFKLFQVMAWNNGYRKP